LIGAPRAALLLTFILKKLDPGREPVTLDQLAIDAPARVTDVDAEEPIMLRLMEMGLVPGASVRIRTIAPFGGPMGLQVRGYLLSIRRDQAKKLRVELEQAP
jgi:ferrous iron transport protein A